MLLSVIARLRDGEFVGQVPVLRCSTFYAGRAPHPQMELGGQRTGTGSPGASSCWSRQEILANSGPSDPTSPPLLGKDAPEGGITT